jgi:glycosyltransferase 2 family protein
LRKNLFLAVKIAISLALLAYLLITADLPALFNRVRNGDPLLLAAAVAIYLVMLLISMWRWHLLLRAQGFTTPFGPLSASYLVATFFNNFLPSNIGGDLIRVRDSARLIGSRTTSLAVVAIDRILGFAALYLLAAGAYVLGGPLVRHLAGARLVIFGLGTVFLALSVIFFQPGIAGRLMGLSGLNAWDFARGRFEVVQGAVHVYRRKVGTVWLAFVASLALQALVVCYFYTVAHGLRIPLGLSACFLMVPLCSLVQALPISFNGWGVREGLFIVYFGQVGLARDSALAFSLVGAGLVVLLSLSGAVVWAGRSSAPEAKA